MTGLLLGLLQALPAPPAPRGFSAREDLHGTARILLASDPRSNGSAIGYLRERLRVLAGYFDSAPLLSGAIADERDQHVQAFFSASLQRQPVTGVVAVELTARGAGFSAILDRPQALAGSLVRLAPGLPGFELAASGGGGSAKLPPMQQVMLPDGSATIRLPAGWRLAGGQKGSCDVVGPGGETLSLGAAAPVWTTPMARLSGLFVAPYSDPVTALRLLSPQIEAGLARKGQPAPRLSRIIESQATPAPVGQAAFVLYESELAGRRLLSLAMVLTSVTGPQQWLFYYSGASAPAEQFAQELPLLRAIWNSFSVTPAEFQRRMDDAVKNMNETWAMLRSTQANATRASLSAAEGWDQVIRGVQTIENRSGYRAEVPNDQAQRWVDRLNETGTGHWRIVPASELVRP